MSEIILGTIICIALSIYTKVNEVDEVDENDE